MSMLSDYTFKRVLSRLPAVLQSVQADIWVVVASSDGVDVDGKVLGPLVFETYTNGATRDVAMQRAAALERRYGPCRIARLVFDDELPPTEKA